MDSVQLCMIGLNSLLWHLVLTCMPIQTALCCIETSMRSCIWSHMVVHCAVCLILRPVCAITRLCSVQCNALRPHIRPELDRNPWLCNLHGCYPVGCGQGHLCLTRYWIEFLFSFTLFNQYVWATTRMNVLHPLRCRVQHLETLTIPHRQDDDTNMHKYLYSLDGGWPQTSGYHATANVEAQSEDIIYWWFTTLPASLWYSSSHSFLHNWYFWVNLDITKPMYNMCVCMWISISIIILQLYWSMKKACTHLSHFLGYSTLLGHILFRA